MKRIYFWPLVVMLVFAACGNENEPEIVPDPGRMDSPLTFSFPISKGVTTYNVIANADESSFSTTDMVVYMVDASNVVEKIFTAEDITGGVNGTNVTATLAISGDATGDKSFYFIANTATVSGKLASVSAGTTTLSELIALVTDDQSAHLSAEGGLLLTGSVKVNVGSITTGGASTSVSLKRRVARFDISNDSTASLLVIKEVLFYNARLSGFVFDNNSPAIPVDGAAGNLPKVDFAAVPDANGGESPSVFYLYPSEDIIIQLLAVLNGVEQLYALPLPAGGIQPNRRYMIKTKPVIGHVFELVVAPWQDDEVLDTDVDGGVSVLSSSSTSETGWDAATYRYDASAAATVITLNVATQSSKGVHYTVTGAPEGYNVVVNVGAPTLTYADVSYRQQVTVTVPSYTEAGPMETKIAIKSSTDSSKGVEITVYSGA